VELVARCAAVSGVTPLLPSSRCRSAISPYVSSSSGLDHAELLPGNQGLRPTFSHPGDHRWRPKTRHREAFVQQGCTANSTRAARPRRRPRLRRARAYRRFASSRRPNGRRTAVSSFIGVEIGVGRGPRRLSMRPSPPPGAFRNTRARSKRGWGSIFGAELQSGRRLNPPTPRGGCSACQPRDRLEAGGFHGFVDRGRTHIMAHEDVGPQNVFSLGSESRSSVAITASGRLSRARPA